MDLIGGYLLVLLVLFSVNISFLIGNYKINNLNLILISSIISLFSLIIMYISRYFEYNLSFIIDIFNYLFIVIAVLILLTVVYYLRDYKNNLKFTLVFIFCLFFISILFLSSQGDLLLINILLYSLFIFIIIFLVYKITKLLFYAKREYPIIIGEYMCLSSILIFIFALTYVSLRELDYSMFSPFLILTPTYQLIYVIIGCIIVLIIGILYNDSNGGNL